MSGFSKLPGDSQHATDADVFDNSSHAFDDNEDEEDDRGEVGQDQALQIGHVIGFKSLPSNSEHENDAPVEETDVEQQQQPMRLRRELGFTSALAVVAGIMVGSGIFSSPGVVLEHAPSAALTLFAFMLSGALVATTSLCYFELQSRFPSDAGGDYRYLQEAYGNRAAFAFATFNFFISKTGSQAIIATIFGLYVSEVLRYLVSPSDFVPALIRGVEGESVLPKALAVALVCASTLINCASVSESAMLQKILTTTKICAMMILSLLSVGVCYLGWGVKSASELAANSFHAKGQPAPTFLGFGSAVVACLWAFDGWADLLFLTEELKDPKQLPFITLTAIGMVTVSYVLLMNAYLLLLSPQEIINSSAIGATYGSVLAERLGIPPSLLAVGVAAVVSVSTCSSCHGSILTGARNYYAVARDGKFPAPLSRITASGVPANALLAQGAWTVTLLLLPSSNFSSLLDYFGPTSWAFYGLASAAVVVLRRQGRAPASFQVPLYPVPPAVATLSAATIVLSALARTPIFTLLAFSIVGLSLPVHYFLYERL